MKDELRIDGTVEEVYEVFLEQEKELNGNSKKAEDIAKDKTMKFGMMLFEVQSKKRELICWEKLYRTMKLAGMDPKIPTNPGTGAPAFEEVGWRNEKG